MPVTPPPSSIAGFAQVVSAGVSYRDMDFISTTPAATTTMWRGARMGSVSFSDNSLERMIQVVTEQLGLPEDLQGVATQLCLDLIEEDGIIDSRYIKDHIQNVCEPLLAYADPSEIGR